MWCCTNLQAPVVKWLTFEVATVPALCPLQGWLQPMMDVPSLLCCMFTAGMWEFLHGLGLWTDVGLSGLGEPSLAEGLWRFGTSGEKDVWAATPAPDDSAPAWPCCPQFGFGGTSEECWEDRPVGLLGGTDRSVCWWWSLGWKASPGQLNKKQAYYILLITKTQPAFTFISLGCTSEMSLMTW